MHTSSHHFSRVLTVFGAGFLVGISGALVFDLGPYTALFSAALGIALLSTLVLIHDRFVVGMIALGFVAIACGIVRVELSTMESSQYLESHVGTHLTLTGIVVKEPDHREHADRLTVETEQGLVLVAAEPYPRAVYGSTITAQGILEKPKDFETESGRMFGYEAYLQKDGIFFILSRAKITIESEGGGNTLQRALFATKNVFLSELRALIPEPESSLLSGLLLGGKQSLGADLLEQFRIAGVVHVVVLSGFNMMIVAFGVMAVCRRLFPMRTALLFGSISILLFALMVGLSATVVRAGIMAEISLLALFLGRQYDILRALGIAGVGMVAASPYILLYDPSFQLSFLATLGLVLLSPGSEKLLSFVSEQFGLREIISATIATQLFLLPFLLWMTGTFSVVAFPANLLIVPFIPLTMLFGFIAGVLGWISYWLAFPFAYVVYLLLSYEIWVATTLASLPFAAFTLPPFSFWWVAATYAVGVGVWYLHRRGRVQGAGDVHAATEIAHHGYPGIHSAGSP